MGPHLHSSLTPQLHAALHVQPSCSAGVRRACRAACRLAARPGCSAAVRRPRQLRVRPTPGVLTAPGGSCGHRACSPPHAAVWRVEQGEAGTPVDAPQSRPGDVASALAAVCQVEAAATHVVGAATTVAQGLPMLRLALGEQAVWAASFGSGVLRLEVQLPRGIQALQWLRGLPQEVREGVVTSERLSHQH